MIKRVHKIVEMQNKLDRDINLTDKEKVKLEKSIKRMKKRFAYTMKNEKIQMEIFFNSWGSHVVVDYENKKIIKVKGEPPKGLKAHLSSFLLAYLILFIGFTLSVILGAFGIISTNLVTTISLVMNGSSIVLNSWNMIDGRKLFKQYKIFIVLFAIVIPFNIYNFINDFQTLFLK